jgi:hypothetical protein
MSLTRHALLAASTMLMAPSAARAKSATDAAGRAAHTILAAARRGDASGVECTDAADYPQLCLAVRQTRY